MDGAGRAIAVVREEEPAFLTAFGMRDLESDPPVTTETRVMLCSVTKSFGARGRNPAMSFVAP